jgi:hypothetical protein
MEQAAQSREEVLQLMKHSRYLHKSGISKLPAEPDEPAMIAEGLAKVDSNMVR